MTQELGDWLSRRPHIQYEDFRLVHPETRQHVSIYMSIMTTYKGQVLISLNGCEGGRTDCSRLLNEIRLNGVSAADSYRIVECSNVLRSNALNDPSAPTETKISDESGNHDLSQLLALTPTSYADSRYAVFADSRFTDS